MKMEQTLPDVDADAEKLSQRVTDLTPEQQALLLRWLEEKAAKSERRATARPSIRRVSREGGVVLSFAQQRLWFLEQLNPGSAAYNLGYATRLTGRLEVEALRRTLAELVRRHESLRTRFVTEGGEPRQLVKEAGETELPLMDLGVLDAGQREEEVRRLCAEEALRPFDLERGPLMRAQLLRLSDEEHVLTLTMHHIISDAWSLGVIVSEVAALYEAYAAGKPSPLPEPEIQYADYAAWQREWLQGETLEAQLEDWKRQLAGAPPVLELPADRPRVPTQAYPSEREICELGPELTQALKRLGHGEGVTPFMTLLAAYAVLLSRHTGQQDIVVGTPIAGRTEAETEGLIGVFINALVLRVNLEGDPTFQELLRRVKAVTLGAYQHQAMPFERLVEELTAERDMRYTPLFQVALVMQNTPMTSPRLTDLRLDTFELESRLTKYELTLTAEEAGRGLTLIFEYARNLFEAETVRRLRGHFVRLLEAACADPGARLSQLPLLTEGELAQLAAWNDTRGDYAPDRCLHELFEEQAARTPEAVAVVSDAGTLTYAELNRRADDLSRRLSALGVGPDVAAGVLLERSTEMVIALLGVLKAGGAYVPLDPAYPAERLRFMLGDSGAGVVLTQERLSGALPEYGGVVVTLDAEGRAAGDVQGVTVRRAGPENLAYVIYTSGSTGRPKGVMIPHRAISNRLLWMQHRFPLSPADAVLQKTTFSFDASVWELFSPLLAGARLVLARPGGERDAGYLAEEAAGRGVTVMQLVPSMLRAWVEEEAAGRCAGLRRMFCGGEALGAEAARGFERVLSGAELVNLYGPTETAIDATFWPWQRDEAADGGAQSGEGGAIVPIGRPLSNVEVHVLDGLMRQVPVGVAGELYVGGVQLARGYLNRPGLTAERFIPDPFGKRPGARLYRTGDVGRRLADGRLVYLERADDQVKVRGYRIELGEVEAALRAYAGVGECVVAAREESGGHKRLVAYVVPAGAAGNGNGDGSHPGVPEPSADELRAFLEERLPAYMVPSVFVVLTKLPLAPNGKIDRRALPAPEEAGASGAKPYQAPRNETETLLAEIWGEVLGAERVGLDDNFFALGGDSIRSIQMRALARKRGLKFSLPQLFRQQTIRELAPSVILGKAEAGDANSRRPFELVPEADRARLPSDLEDAYPLTALQMGMIFHSEFTSDAVYQNARSYKLRAAFDPEALREAIARSVTRHAALRTSFDLSTYSEPLQLVHRHAETPLTVHDLRHLSPTEQDAVLARALEEERERHFDWKRAPLVRFTAHRLEDDLFQFTMTEHHVIIDGWSVATLLNELFKLYLALMGDEPPAAEPPPAAQFRDYVSMEREALRSEESRRYWEGQLAFETVTEVPRLSQVTDSGQPWEVVNVDLPLTTEVAEAASELARTMSVSLKSVLLASHLKVMSFLSGQSGVVTGLVSNGRPEEAGGDKVLGLFLNTLPLRADLPAGTWADLIRETFAAESAMLPHRRYPMAELQKRQPGRPLFETAFNFTHFHVLSGLETIDEVQVLDVTGFGETSFTLLASFNVNVVSSQIILLLSYNRGELADEQVRAMGEYYRRALTRMVLDPEARHDTTTLLSDEEERRQLYGWNETAEEYPRDRCLHELFEEQAARTPEAVAVAAGAERLSYAELNRRGDELAARLRGEGVGPEVPVGVLMERSAELLVGLLGVLKAGGAYVPLDPAYPAARLRFMLEDSGARVLLTQARLLSLLDWSGGSAARVVCVDDGPEGADAAPAGAARVADVTGRRADSSEADSSDLAYVIYTSGSTGRPKGVAIEHRSAVALVSWARGLLEEDELAGVLASTSVCFDLSVFELFVPLSCGGKVILVRDALHLPEGVAGDEVTLVNTVPSVMAELLSSRGVPASVRAVLLAGEPLPSNLVREIYEHEGVRRVLNLYGPTEDTTYSTGATMPRDGRGRVLIGRPVANKQSYVLDERMLPVPAGTPGELYLGGAGLARCYLARPGLTAEKFVPNPFADEAGARLYRTGDVARLLPDGQIDYLGRRDNQVKLRGFRIELSEVESVLREHEQVRAAAVLVREDAPGDRRLVAYVVPATVNEVTGVAGDIVGSGPDAAELRAYVRGRLPEHMVPSAFVQLEALPLTSNGKLDRRALPAPERGDLESRRAYVAPRDGVEAQLAKIWEEVIGVSPVGVDDNFFELGGHSLSAIRLMARVEMHFGRKLPLSMLIREGNVARMAEALTGEPTRRSSPLVPIQPAGPKLPFFSVHPSGGGVLCYVTLAQRLGADRPFYGLQDPILDGAERACDSVPRMAADYVEALRAVQPAGPYLLGGYSFGGVVAFEMARQLRADGVEVAALVMLDSMSPVGGKYLLEVEDLLGIDDSLILYLHAAEHARQMGRAFSLPVDELRAAGPGDRLLHVFGRAKEAELLPPEVGLPDVHRYVGMHRARRQAIQSYACEPYAGPITLFRTSEPPHEYLKEVSGLLDPVLLAHLNDEQARLARQPFYGWDQLSTHPVAVHHIAGSHDTLLLEPNVERLGRQLALCLNEAEAALRAQVPDSPEAKE